MKQQFISTYTFITLFLLVSVYRPSVIYAQEGKTHALEELIVTAQKRVETQQDISASFNVYSAENLAATGWSNVTDMADLIPSMEVIGATKTRTTVFIRSIGTNKYDIGTEGSIGVFVDGVYIPRFSSLMQNLIDLERIEILRGPQGTLYGRNTIGGAISIYSKEPNEEFGGKVNLGLANEDSWQVGLSMSGPLSEKVLGYLALTTRETGGFRTALPSERVGSSPFSKTSDDEHVKATRVKLIYLANDELTMGLTLEYSEQEVDAFTGELIASEGDSLFVISPSFLAPFISQADIDTVIAKEAADTYESTVNTAGFTEVESLAASFKVEWMGEDISMESIFGYRDEDVDELTDSDRTEFDIIQQVTEQSSETFSEEFKISSESGGAYTFDDKLDWLGGVFLYIDKADRRDVVNLGMDSSAFGGFDFAGQGPPFFFPGWPGPSLVDIFPPPYPLDFFVDLETRSWAVFGQATYYFTDEWSFTTGLRYSKDIKEFSYTESTPGIEFLVPADNFSFDDELTFESTDPKFVLEYEPQWVEDMMVYLSYAKGYKSGGIQFIARREDVARDSFDKETLYAWELGMKSRWFDQSLQVNGAIYSYDYENQQIQAITVVSGATMIVTDNAGSSTLEGVEVDVQYRATEHLTLQGSVSYLDATFDDYIRSDGLDLSGNTLPAAPEWSYWLSAEYIIPFENGWSSGLRLDYSWRDDQVFTPDGLFVEDDYAITNLAYWINDPDEVWKLRLYCKNCASTDYRTSVTPLVGVTGWGATGDQRRYGVDLSYFF